MAPIMKGGKAKTITPKLAALHSDEWRARIEKRYLPRISKCLQQLSEDEIWWRPNPASNSIGNLVLHLSGNMRQWIIAGLGGAPDLRKRDEEFSEQGPLPRQKLIRELQNTVKESCRVVARLSPQDLLRHYTIQGFDVTGYSATADVLAHFAYHSGQIFYVTKLRRSKDLGFTRLPRASGSKNLHSGG
jgi:uncharacterized damage-inducible protein DinB